MYAIPDETRALIFDCDGTLADTMPIHYRAWNEAFKRFGTYFSEDKFYAMAGIPTVRIIEMLNAENGTQLPVHEVARLKEIFFEENLHEVKPIASVVAVVNEYYRKLPMAVATGGIRRLCEKTLDAIGIRNKFLSLVTAEDVVRGKPAPDIFLKAAEDLQIDPKYCLVFEDADLGIQGGLAAGMAVIDVRERD